MGSIQGFSLLLDETFNQDFVTVLPSLFVGPLTHISVVSLLWDIGKQHSPRCDAAERGVPSEDILFA